LGSFSEQIWGVSRERGHRFRRGRVPRDRTSVGR
jgi:hypothetical protein